MVESILVAQKLVFVLFSSRVFDLEPKVKVAIGGCNLTKNPFFENKIKT